MQEMEQYRQEHKNAPTTVRHYEIDGEKFTVVRHYIGKKDINEVIHKIAIRRAYAEMGLTKTA